MCSKDEVCLASRDFATAANNDIVADDSAEAINLSPELNLDDFSLFYCCRSLLGVRLERRVRGNVRARGNGRAVPNALDDLFAFVDLGDLLL